MLILNKDDILNSVTIDELLKAVEEAFIIQEKGNFLMPDRSHIDYNENVLLLMPAFAGDYFSTKLVSVFPGNRKKNLPAIFGSVLLNDGTTGETLALLEASKLTALRTAAVGALGIVHTTPVNISALGLIGAGTQGFHQVLFACAVRNIKTVTIFDSFNSNLNDFVNSLKKYLPEIDFKIAKDSEEVVKYSEVIITATTSETPVVPDNKDLLKGKHFIGIGSYKPSMREFPDNLFRLLDSAIIDTPFAMKESGDISVPIEKGLIKKEDIYTLGSVMNKIVRINENGTTLFKSVGMALFDLITARLIYIKASEKNLGTSVEF